MADDAGSLRPVRRPRLPRGSTLLRAGLVAALLGLAAAVLQTPAGCPPAPSQTTAPGAARHQPPGGADPDRPAPAGSAGTPGQPTPAGAPGQPGTGGASRPGGNGGASQPGADDEASQPGADTGAGRSGTGGALPLPSGAVGVPVRLAEPAALAVLRPGARVDLLVVPAGGRAGEAVLLASGAQVLDVVGAAALDGSSALYLALTPGQAQRAVGQPEGSRFAVVVRG
ncbi:flagellar biosynthesis protein FlgA [Micromonospora siamensis]|uniref:Flagellar biosynthesis protein FlgA n=1 Tax=Micromonospora siamensis TaxID=299152 RepID=A0A1C5HAA1_9ACTN|nr:flagellar biosynthesis protein FlgA [Micromonospora siamensis]SCG42900.1 hypothetical protein GA0074704_1337 [Micromonospora siamensis]